jgi:hypothetical protein
MKIYVSSIATRFSSSKPVNMKSHFAKWVQARTAPWMAGPNELNGFQPKAVKMGLGPSAANGS